ncbi:MAG: hypothetical protein Fur0024_2380 [Patescibacteria group bacterium]
MARIVSRKMREFFLGKNPVRRYSSSIEILHSKIKFDIPEESQKAEDLYQELLYKYKDHPEVVVEKKRERRWRGSSQYVFVVCAYKKTNLIEIEKEQPQK